MEMYKKLLLVALAILAVLGFVSSFYPSIGFGPPYTPSFDEYVLDANTVALWHMNEGSGNNVYDETTNDNDGTVIDGTWTINGKFGNAMEFDGLDDKISVPYSRSIGEFKELTLEAWVKRSSENDGMIISKNGPYFLSVRNNVVEGGVYAGPGWTHVNGITNLELDVWNHIALTYDGSFIKVYLNGFEDGSISKTGNVLVTGQGLYMGWGEPGHDQYFAGAIDEVRISNIARKITHPSNRLSR